MRRKVVFVALLALAGACTREQWHRFPSPDDAIALFPWFATMQTHVAIRPYKMPLQPVPGTVPVTGIELVPAAQRPNRAALARLRNPMQNTSESFERGRDRYNIYCGVCHGVTGEGDGPVASALPAGIVRNLTEQRMRDLSDGWLYAVIVNGFGALMPEYGSKLTSEDRWHIVNYVRVLQGAAQ